MNLNKFLIYGIFLVSFVAAQKSSGEEKLEYVKDEGVVMIQKIIKSDSEWKEILNPEVYKIIRKKGTEPPFSGQYNDFKKEGIFTCAACGLELFSSGTKFDSGTGWPSFFSPISAGHVAEIQDNSLFMKRTEVFCARCDAHLGHVFDDGPLPTKFRYCINSLSLDFVERAGE